MMSHPSIWCCSGGAGQGCRPPTLSNLLRCCCRHQAVATCHPFALTGGQASRRALAARMMRSAVRWLTFHSAASSAADGLGAGTELGQDAGEPLVARVRVRLGGSAGGAGLVAAAHARAAVGRGPHRGPLPQRSAAAPGWPCRRRRARGSSRGGGWRGSRPGWRSAACGRLRRRRPGRPGRRSGRPGSATRSCPAGAPRARRSTRLRTSSPSGRSARPSPDAPSWPGPGTSR